jgi:hypothetical protein
MDKQAADQATATGSGCQAPTMSRGAEHVPSSHAARHVPAEDQLRRQGIQPIASVDELAFPGLWESDEELDEFLTDLYASRRASTPGI